MAILCEISESRQSRAEHGSASSGDLDAVPKRNVAFNVGRSGLRLWVVPGCILVSLPVHLYVTVTNVAKSVDSAESARLWACTANSGWADLACHVGMGPMPCWAPIKDQRQCPGPANNVLAGSHALSLLSIFQTCILNAITEAEQISTRGTPTVADTVQVSIQLHSTIAACALLRWRSSAIQQRHHLCTKRPHLKAVIVGGALPRACGRGGGALLQECSRV